MEEEKVLLQSSLLAIIFSVIKASIFLRVTLEMCAFPKDYRFMFAVSSSFHPPPTHAFLQWLKYL